MIRGSVMRPRACMWPCNWLQLTVPQRYEHCDAALQVRGHGVNMSDVRRVGPRACPIRHADRRRWRPAPLARVKEHTLTVLSVAERAHANVLGQREVCRTCDEACQQATTCARLDLTSVLPTVSVHPPQWHT